MSAGSTHRMLAVPDSQDAPAKPKLTAPQKAALVIAALGPDAAAPIIEKIGDKHLRAFAEAYARLDRVPREDLAAVAREFTASLSGGGRSVGGGVDAVRELLSRFKEPEAVTKMLDEVDAPGGRSVWEKLDDAPDAAIAAFLQTQHPQAVAAILSRMSTDKASSVLGCLDAALAENALARLAKPIAIRREALRLLADTIEREFLAPMRNAARARRPGLAIGAMMNNMPPDKRDNFLKFIETNAPDILDDVKSCILTFEDVPTRLPPNAAPLVVRETEADLFLKAMKYGKQNAPDSVEFIFKNISQRMKQQYEEEMEKLKQVTVVEAEAAQAAFMATVRRLVASGDIVLNKIEDPEAEEQVAYI